MFVLDTYIRRGTYIINEMLMYSLHVRICKSLVQGQPNISQFPCTVPIYNKSAKTFRDASQEPIFQ